MILLHSINTQAPQQKDKEVSQGLWADPVSSRRERSSPGFRTAAKIVDIMPRIARDEYEHCYVV